MHRKSLEAAEQLKSAMSSLSSSPQHHQNKSPTHDRGPDPTAHRYSSCSSPGHSGGSSPSALHPKAQYSSSDDSETENNGVAKVTTGTTGTRSSCPGNKRKARKKGKDERSSTAADTEQNQTSHDAHAATTPAATAVLSPQNNALRVYQTQDESFNDLFSMRRKSIASLRAKAVEHLNRIGGHFFNDYNVGGGGGSGVDGGGGSSAGVSNVVVDTHEVIC